MIVFSENSGLRKSIGYKDLAKRYLEYHNELCEENFVVNMIFMLDEWEKQEGFKFDRVMPSDWDLLLKAVKVLNVEHAVISN